MGARVFLWVLWQVKNRMKGCCAFKREGFVEEADVQMEGTALWSLWAHQVSLAKLIFFLV